jgi:hypothetical protein
VDAAVDLADDVVLDGVEKGDDDILAAHLQLLLARCLVSSIERFT